MRLYCGSHRDRLADKDSIRLLDINAPEVAHPEHGKKAEAFGDAAQAYARKLLPDGQTVRVVLDSHPKAAGKEVHGRQLATVETLPAPFDKLLRVPILGKLIPAQEFQTEMIGAGLADTHYRNLSGATDTQEAHDAARAAAQAAGKGIWSEEGRSALPWVGTEKTHEQIKADMAARRAQQAEKMGYPAPGPEADTRLGNLLGTGLMVSGNSGAFPQMGAGGNLVAQGWNALLAGIGVREYNAKAKARPLPTVYVPPAGVRTEYEKKAAGVTEKRRARAPR